MKCVDIRFKLICHYAQARFVQPSFVKSGKMIADLITKALSAPRIVALCVNLIAIQDEVDEGD